MIVRPILEVAHNETRTLDRYRGKNKTLRLTGTLCLQILGGFLRVGCNVLTSSFQSFLCAIAPAENSLPGFPERFPDHIWLFLCNELSWWTGLLLLLSVALRSSSVGTVLIVLRSTIRILPRRRSLWRTLTVRVPALLLRSSRTVWLTIGSGLLWIRRTLLPL